MCIGLHIGPTLLCPSVILATRFHTKPLGERRGIAHDVILTYNEVGCGCESPRGRCEKNKGHMGICPFRRHMVVL